MCSRRRRIAASTTCSRRRACAATTSGSDSSGRPAPDPDRRSTLFPLVSLSLRRPGALAALLTGDALQRDGEPELCAAITDPAVRDEWLAELERHHFFAGQLHEHMSRKDLKWVAGLRDVAAGLARAAGFPMAELGRVDRSPVELDRVGERIVVAGVAVFTRRHASAAIESGALRAWSARDVGGTAFASLYAGAPAGSDPGSGSPHLSPLVLDASQRRAVDAATDAPISVISGPPGTGKSQTVVAMAFEAVARGERVLVAAPSDAAVRASPT